MLTNIATTWPYALNIAKMNIAKMNIAKMNIAKYVSFYFIFW